jgi:isochorismatase family protein
MFVFGACRAFNTESGEMAALLRPADCGVILVDPRARHASRMDPTRQTDLARSLDLLLDASLVCAVPVHIAFADTPPEAGEWATARPPPQAHVHGLGTAGESWTRSGIHEALATQSRHSLILAGFWLETAVTFLALQAATSGFEVFVPMDAAPASSDVSARPATDRLLQAGVVTITTRQLIAEWIEASPDAEVRSALALLASSD